MNPLRFTKLQKIFEKSGAGLGSISAEIPTGEWVCFLGPSGSGKSTLLKLVADLEKPSSGQLTHSYARDEISFVFQDSALLPWKTAFQNILLPLELKGHDTAGAHAAVRDWIQRLHLTGYEDQYPHELSGGQKMRVSLARALVTQPKLLLLDEPFAALDEPIRIELGLELRKLFNTMKPTVLMVTHSITEALWLADRVMVFQNRPGTIVMDELLPFGLERPLSLRGRPEFLAKVESCFELLRAKA